MLVETTEGFGTDLATNQPVTSTGWTEVSNWDVAGSDGRAGLFSLGSGFDPSSGRYTASVEGVYFASAQIRLDGADTGLFQVNIGPINVTLYPNVSNITAWRLAGVDYTNITMLEQITPSTDSVRVSNSDVGAPFADFSVSGIFYLGINGSISNWAGPKTKLTPPFGSSQPPTSLHPLAETSDVAGSAVDKAISLAINEHENPLWLCTV